MIGLVVTGHGHFADGIHTSAQMIAGGVYGKVVGIDDEDTLRVEVAPKVVITISRCAVQSLMQYGGIPPYLLLLPFFHNGKAPAECSAFCGGLVICAAKSGSGHPEGHPLPLRFYVIKPCRCCRRLGSCS